MLQKKIRPIEDERFESKFMSCNEAGTVDVFKTITCL